MFFPYFRCKSKRIIFPPLPFGVLGNLLPCIFGVSKDIEVKNSNARFDLVIQHKENIIPIEVKAGIKGAIQSMHLFMKEMALKKRNYNYT